MSASKPVGISSEGQFVKEFEKEMAKDYGQKVWHRNVQWHCCLGGSRVRPWIFSPGDEVILPAFTIISCVAAIVRKGCVPVLIDSDPITWNMDVSQD